jgi:hypothetical protein
VTARKHDVTRVALRKHGRLSLGMERHLDQPVASCLLHSLCWAGSGSMDPVHRLPLACPSLLRSSPGVATVDGAHRHLACTTPTETVICTCFEGRYRVTRIAIAAAFFSSPVGFVTGLCLFHRSMSNYTESMLQQAMDILEGSGLSTSSILPA